MRKLEELTKLYDSSAELFTEKGFLDAVIYIKEWSSLTDIEKIKKRKNRLKYNEIHFNETIQEKKKYDYEKSVIKTSELIMLFMEKTDIFLDIEMKNISNNYLFRISNLLYCEKFLINNHLSYKMINHVPYEIFEPLIEKINKSQEYKEYGLEGLFKEYKKMTKLYNEEPYE
ncbi:hypothetical protein [Flavobacterium sp. 140616W15]|uniref:hypothetical protein n=1 Tax=Flavobacterium sp. 140616W15 TaxID=2478552 RepID=UPI000F0CDC10|nr:hypothetical protein [Flavobacterium sp. 140616W15]AYN03303.1 hypothetical protein EAG11_03290 [Flavobacterium sp. 140616W15]